VAVAARHERRLGAERLARRSTSERFKWLTTSRSEMGAPVAPAALSMRSASWRMVSVE